MKKGNIQMVLNFLFKWGFPVNDSLVLSSLVSNNFFFVRFFFYIEELSKYTIVQIILNKD